MPQGDEESFALTGKISAVPYDIISSADQMVFQVWVMVVVVRAQVWDVERLIRARNPGAVFTTTERADVTWQTLRSITYSPTLHQGAVGSASVQEASLVRR